MKKPIRLLAAAALLHAACSSEAPAPAPGASAAASKPAPAGKIDLVFTYGSEKESWLKEVTAAFNAQRQTTASGKTIAVQAIPLGSGECIDELLSGTRQAHLTSPASSAFIKLGNAQSRAKTGKDLVGSTESLVLSPVVIAMWKPMAEALGWGKKPIGWSDILAMAREKRGWAARGFPQWGSFKFGHTHPEASNSGLIALFAEVYAAAGKQKDLTSEDLRKPATSAFVSAIERAVVHYGSSTGFFGRGMFERGPSYLSAAVLYENMVIESYSSKYTPPFPVVAVYPKEGTFWSDHPVGVVEADWVTAEHKEAARTYIQYLLAPEQQAKAVPNGFRPALVEVPLAAPIDTAHGVDPKEPQTTLEVPGAPTIEAILQLWRDNKRHANVALVLDVSGSMNSEGGARIANAKAGAQQLAETLADADRFSLMVFNQTPHWLLEGQTLKDTRSQAVSTIQSVLAEGGTAMYDAIDMAFQRLAEERKTQADKISALVVLSDGEDSHSQMKLDTLLDRIRFDGEDRVVRVFTIAYGKDAKRDVLQRIADATQAKSYEGNPQNIRTVFREISTFF
jgi:Ca-activated chloride channel family protein